MSNSGVLPGEHLVCFYRDDAELVAAIAPRLRSALDSGGFVLLITTPEHRTALEAAVGASARSAAAAVPPRLVWADASETAERVIAGSVVDAAAFETSVASLVRRVPVDGRVVCVFGEAVSMLWAGGHLLAAIELEALWNRLRTQVPFSLLCGHPAALATGADAIDAFERICAEHTEILLAAPEEENAEVSRRFPAAAAAVSRARAFVSDTVRGWSQHDLADATVQVVSELAANAVTHAESDFTVGLSRIDGGVRVAVGDRLAAPPRPRTPAVTEPHGRGLLLVEALSRRWGHRRVPGGKLVWAELADGKVTQP